MQQYILRRLLISIPTLLIISMIIFFLINSAPGDPLLQMIDPEIASMGDAWLERERERLDLDKPIHVRYGIWLTSTLTGNLGYSYNSKRPVSEVIVEKLPNTVELMGCALLIAMGVGLPIGIASAIKQYSGLDYIVTGISFVFLAMPVFFFAMLMIYIFSIKLDMFPAGGLQSLGQQTSLWDHLWHLVLPASMLGLHDAATWARYARSSMLEVIRQDFVTTIRAKGFKEGYILFRHALPNAVGPLITIFGLSLPTLIAGAVITETVFAWPGIGKLAVEAVTQRDYPILMGVTSLIAVVVLISNLLADIGYSLFDPRIRYK